MGIGGHRMSEVEKLYKNAGIEPKYKDYRTKNGKTYEDKNPNNRNIRLLYPEFTAEKQLELIEFYIKSVWWLNLACFKSSSLPFDEELAKLTNHLWEDMTISQQEQIKRILK